MCLIIININPVYELMIFNHHGNGSTFNHSSFLSIAAHSRYDCNYLYRLPFVWFQCYGPARSVIMPLFTKFSMEFHMNSQKMWSNILSNWNFFRCLVKLQCVKSIWWIFHMHNHLHRTWESQLFWFHGNWYQNDNLQKVHFILCLNTKKSKVNGKIRICRVEINWRWFVAISNTQNDDLFAKQINQDAIEWQKWKVNMKQNEIKTPTKNTNAIIAYSKVEIMTQREYGSRKIR